MIYGQRNDVVDGQVTANGIAEDKVEAIVRKAGLI